MRTRASCNKCGDCCRAIVLEEPKSVCIRELKDGERKSEHDAESIQFMAKHWHRISKKEASKIIAPAKESNMYYYTCDMLGKDNLCKCYDDRPPICRAFPMCWFKDNVPFNSQYKNCSFNGVTISFKEVGIK